MKKIILSAAILFTAFSVANAQESTASQNVALTLTNSIDITITGGSGNNFTFGSTSDYTSGLTNLLAASFLVKSNRAYAVTVNSAAANFTSTSGTTMPSSVLAVRLNGSTPFSNLNTTAATLTSGARGTNVFAIDYTANPGFNYDAGAYNMSVVYTATQQ